MADSKAASLVKEIKVAPPTGCRTMYLDGLPDSWPCADKPGHKGAWSACFAMAKRSVRVALENGCTEIIVRKGVHHRHRFDVADLLKTIKRELGGKLPSPNVHPKVLPSLATTIMKSKGSWFDTSRLVVPVGITLPSRSPQTRPGRDISISGVGRLKGVTRHG